MLRLLGNLLWFIFGGLELGLGWWLAGLLCCATIIGIPFGIAAFRIGNFTFWPFGREAVDKPSGEAGAALSLIGNILWIVVCGWWLALAHLAAALLWFLTILGIPFGWQHLKLAAISLVPFGKKIVSASSPLRRSAV